MVAGDLDDLGMNARSEAAFISRIGSTGHCAWKWLRVASRERNNSSAVHGTTTGHSGPGHDAQSGKDRPGGMRRIELERIPGESRGRACVIGRGFGCSLLLAECFLPGPCSIQVRFQPIVSP